MKRLVAIILTTMVFSSSIASASAPGIDLPVKEVQEAMFQFTVSKEVIEKEVEYEYADYIWKYLKDLGFNDYVCAGILGNMMVEVGGGTLELQPTIEGKIHYGVCQWNKKYYPSVVGTSLEVQCDFLRDTIKDEIDVFGNGYDNFIAMENERDAALEFAKSYERCGTGGYEKRQNCASIAYEYFTNRSEVIITFDAGPCSVELKSGFRNFEGN